MRVREEEWREGGGSGQKERGVGQSIYEAPGYRVNGVCIRIVPI